MLRQYLSSLIILTALLQSIQIQAQKLSLSADSILIGDQVSMSIETEVQNNTAVVFPSFPDTLTGGLLVLSSGAVDSSQAGSLIKKYTITAFDDSLFEIPPLPVLINQDTFYTNPALLRVKYFVPDSIFMARIDTSQSIPIADIKPPLNTPMTFAEFWQRYGSLILIIAGSLALIAIGLYIYIRKKQNKPIFLTPKPKTPPHIKALAALQSIKENGIPEGERLKVFYDKLSYTIRVYIEERFEIPAPDYVRTEIMQALGTQTEINRALREDIGAMLLTADLVKFAKFRPGIHDSEAHLKNAFTFVHKTAQKTDPENDTHADSSLTDKKNSETKNEITDKAN